MEITYIVKNGKLGLHIVVDVVATGHMEVNQRYALHTVDEVLSTISHSHYQNRGRHTDSFQHQDDALLAAPYRV